MMDIDPSASERLQVGDRPLSLSDFARQHQITEDRVWEFIEEGELAARFVNDEILILREKEQPADPLIETAAEPSIAEPMSSAAPLPEPMLETRPKPELKTADESYTADMDSHSIRADEQRDFLLFAQDAMNRTMDLSRQLLATKDELLRMKDERIQHLTHELQKGEQDIRRLKKQVENLETLCRINPSI